MFSRFNTWRKSKKKLAVVLIVPFVVQIIFIGLLAAGLTYNNGLRSVNTVTNNLRTEVSKRIESHIRQFLSSPFQINQTNANLFRSGQLAIDDAAAIQEFFLSQVNNFQSITSIYFGNLYGGIVGAGREGPEGDYYIYATENLEPGNFHKFQADENGNAGNLIVTVGGFDARTRPWYSTATHKKTNAWSDIYFLATGQDMAIASSLPVYDTNEQFIGVVSVDIFLSQLHDFMHNLEISENGIAYIIDRQGELVIASPIETEIVQYSSEGQPERIFAKESKTDIIATTTSYIEEEFGSLYKINDKIQLDYRINSGRYYIQVTPIVDGNGIDWISVVVVPESDFMGDIRINNIITIASILLALLVTVLFNLYLVRRISQPVAKLSEFTHLVGNERWDAIKSLNSWIYEIDSLGDSFIIMGQKLRLSLQNLKNEIEDRKQVESNLRMSEDRYRSLAENITIGILRTTIDGELIQANQALYNMFGLKDQSRTNNRNILDFIAYQEQKDEFIRFIKEDGKVTNYEIEFVKINHERFWGSITSRMKKDETGELILDSTIENINERKTASEKLEYIATHDRVTELPNRILFEDRLKHAIKIADRRGNQIVVLLLDLDNFKSVNDAFGHKQGDQLLNIIGQRLLTCVRNSDTVARIGGDEFTIILEGINNIEDSYSVIDKILLDVSKPVRLSGAEVYVTCSIGVSVYPVDGKNVDELVQNADHSLYKVKDSGKNDFQFYSTEMRTEVLQRLELKNQLRYALEKNELFIHYQPVVNAKTNTIYAAEALVRWNHPEKGLLFPGKFISLAEETGLIVPIGTWMLKESCKQMKAWIDEGLKLSHICVNISHRQFRSKDLLDVIKTALDESDLPPEKLELELSENILFKEPDIDFTVLDRITELGVRLAIDDFGTGYTSLSRFNDFHFDTLKIDRFFATHHKSEKDAAVVQGIILIAKEIGMDIVAEGIETIEELDFYCSFGCHHIQGWYFSKAISPENLVEFRQSLARK